MKKTDDRYWLAFCVGFDEENGKILASILTFWAINRFHALKAIEGMLPDHENWVKPDGTTRPHQLYTLEQCRPEEAEMRGLFYAQTFSEVISPTGPVHRGVA